MGTALLISNWNQYLGVGRNKKDGNKGVGNLKTGIKI